MREQRMVAQVGHRSGWVKTGLGEKRLLEASFLRESWRASTLGGMTAQHLTFAPGLASSRGRFAAPSLHLENIMAKKFFDANAVGAKDAIAQQDGTALTLTTTVRILYDDTIAVYDLIVAIERSKERLIEVEN